MVNQPYSNYDNPWKEALDVYFKAFMELCFLQIHGDINWSRGYESLDVELREVVRDAETGNRLADKLVKVWLNSGQEVVVLVHIEIQSQVKSNFPKKMYVYNHRLFDRYDQEVISLAVLGDDQVSWRPTDYGYSRWGFESRLQFPVVKLLDFRQRWAELELSSNPFSVVIMAHLSTLETAGNPPLRLQSKLSLVRGLYERGYTRSQILDLFRLIEWMMVLPEPWEGNFKEEFKRDREERRMPYIASFERDAMLINARESVIDVLETRFEAVPSELSNRLEEIKDITVLKRLLKQSITINSVEEFERLLDEIASQNPTNY